MASTLPLSLNRYFLVFHGDIYNYLFGSKSSIFYILAAYDASIFGLFYIFYVFFNFFKILPYRVYFICTIPILLINNILSLFFSISVLRSLQTSIYQVDVPEHIIKDRKIVAWVIIFQSFISILLTFIKIVGLYNTFLQLAILPTIECYSKILNFIDSYGYVFQEFFVCVDYLIYLLVLNSYREFLVKFFKGIASLYRIQSSSVAHVPNSWNNVRHGNSIT